jgi:hypothetical protein
MKRFLAACALVAFATCLTPTQAAPVQGDPYDIFARARAVWSLQHYPHYLSYTIAVQVTERGVDKTKHYHLSYDSQTDNIDVNPVSDEEKAAPPVPTGFLWHLKPKRQFQTLFDKKVGNPGEAVDYLGVPKLAPTYSFGMGANAGTEDGRNDDALVAQIRAQYNDPMPAAKDRELTSDGKLKSIASVTSRAHNYTIQLDGVETIAGTPCYHLTLKPNGNPRVFRLRDLWVDTQTFQTRQLVTDGNFTASAVPWLITFESVGGALYIASEAALAPVGVGPHRYERASIAFQAITPSTAPTRMSGTFVTKQDLMTEPDPGKP